MGGGGGVRAHPSHSLPYRPVLFVLLLNPAVSMIVPVVRGGGTSPRNLFGIFTLEVPFPGFPSHSDKILASFQLGKCFYYQKYIIMTEM